MSKPKLSLFPRNALWLASEVLTEGEKKHPKFGWRDGSHTITSLLDKVLRHTMNFIDGNDFDEDSGSLNLAHAAADLALAIDLYITRKDLDDRYNNSSMGIPDKTVGVNSINLSDLVNQSQAEFGNYQFEYPIPSTEDLNKKEQEELHRNLKTFNNSLKIPSMDEQINAIINDEYDVESDNNSEESMPMLLTKGMKLIHKDGQVIEVQTNGTFFIKKGSQITW